jgi:NAD(P)-dependent dehydrogenase (short-subunit alcohol dehydrogenase family)
MAEMDRNCRFEGKSVVVTGAGMGIGQGAAVAFAREGGNVIAADISAEAADQTAREITSAAGKAISVRCDVSKAGGSTWCSTMPGSTSLVR